jgi:hypothetical protein
MRSLRRIRLSFFAGNFTAEPRRILRPNYVFKPTAEEVARIIHTPSRGGGLTRR